MFRPKNQADHVALDQPPQPNEYVEQLVLPGIANLHNMSREDIADTLANILKSRTNIKALRYEVGKCIELTLSRT
jgi:hypothetical protein